MGTAHCAVVNGLRFPSLPEMSLGLFPAGDLKKGLTLLLSKNLSEPQERQDSYLALSAVHPEQLRAGSRVRKRTHGELCSLGLSEDLYHSFCLRFTSISVLWVLRGKTVNPPGGICSSLQQYFASTSWC